MIGNLYLKFKKGILKNNVYKEEDLKEYNIKLVVGLDNETDLYYYVDNDIYDILETVGIKHSGEVECIFN